MKFYCVDEIWMGRERRSGKRIGWRNGKTWGGREGRRTLIIMEGREGKGN